MLNKASKKINQLFTNYCDAEAIARLTGNGFFANLIRNFNGGFDSYIEKSCHLYVISYSSVQDFLKKPKNKHIDPNQLCVFDPSKRRYRFVTEKDAGTVRSLIRKWYQSSGEIDLRLILLFDSKIGSKYIAKETYVPQKVISDVRHHYLKVNDIDPADRLALENFYLNSRFAQHITNVKATLEL